MAQSTDIILNSAGYMIEPGTHASPGYRRAQDGMAEGLTKRTSITDFFGGQNRALQLERDTFYASTNIGPALGGQGVRPWGRLQGAGAISGIVGDRATPVPYAIVKDRLYYAVGNKLYRGPVTTTGGSYAQTLWHTFTNTITDLTIFNSAYLLIAFGNAADIQFYNLATQTAAAYLAGERGTYIQAYAGNALWSDARSGAPATNIRMGKGTGVDTRLIDHDPISMTTVGAELLIATKQALYTFTGRVKDVMVPNPAYPAQPNPQIPGLEWSGEFTPFFQQGVLTESADFRFITGYGGRTIAWIAGGVHELVPSGDRAGWRSTGLSGKQCFGGCVANGYVIISIESHSGMNELWAYDGNGWWRIGVQAMSSPTWCNPMPIGGAGTGGHFAIMIMLHGSANHQIMQLTESTVGTSYATTAEWVSPMIDAGERDKRKAWRKIGAIFASPELQGNTASTDALNVYLDYSIDAGATWTIAASAGLAGNTLANMNRDFEAALSGIVSRFIMLRVRWASVDDWAPILTGVWAEHETLENPARRRKWSLRIHARDQEVDRDGVMLTRTGRQLIAELWAAWQSDTTLTFRDIDYDADPTQRNVRIVGISEVVAQPADANEWGEALITLNLVEV